MGERGEAERERVGEAEGTKGQGKKSKGRGQEGEMQAHIQFSCSNYCEKKYFGLFCFDLSAFMCLSYFKTGL